MYFHHAFYFLSLYQLFDFHKFFNFYNLIRKIILNMSEEEYERFQNLGEEIKTQLKEAILTGEIPESEKGKRIVLLHKEWLGKTWKQYTKEAHVAVGNMYISDERFQLYYDKEVAGCAAFLEKAIRYWVERL